MKIHNFDSTQLALAGRTGNIWTAWRNIGSGVLATYPELLVNRRFEDIIELASKL